MNTMSVPTLNTFEAGQRLSKAATLFAVVSAHVLGLVWAAQQLSVTPPTITPPSVVGILLAPEPKTVPPPPTQQVKPPPKLPPKPVPVTKPEVKPVAKPEPSPLAQAKSEPAPEAPPAQASPPAPPAPAAPVEQAKPAPEAIEPITPPSRVDASRLDAEDPNYPALSRRLGEQGVVVLDIHVLADGSVGEVKLKTSSGFARLDNSAIQAVKTWKFQPAKRGNRPIPLWYTQSVSFVLKK
ncbi:MAG TPA: energy transducer TonB [Limnobacter sp.]|nr:energy transducer TonB [Limnobacter sp.]